MKTRRVPIINLIILVLCSGIICLKPQTAIAQEAGVSFQVFYDNLSPYGNWVDYSGYGYVWIPNAGLDFAPYSTAGHWVYSDDGWVWVSDYDWGWAPFHYGRWYYDNAYGWLWVPGEEWGPAWVSWRSCDGYYGWAPLGPGVGIEFGDIPADRWCFVREGYITNPTVYRYYAPRNENSSYISRSIVLKSSNGSHVTGPHKEDVEKSTHSTVTPVKVQSNTRPGQTMSGNTLNIYKPSISKTTASAPHPTPAKVSTLKEIPQRSTVNQNTITPNKKTSNPASNNNSSNKSQTATKQPTQKITELQKAHTQNYPTQQVNHSQSTKPQAHSSQQQQQSKQETSVQNQQPPQHKAPAPQHQSTTQRQTSQQHQAPTQQQQAPAQQHQIHPQQPLPPPQQHQAPPQQQPQQRIPHKETTTQMANN